ncbi:MAG: pyridoxamine 5'-phosphate oxidase [Flavobacteriaceae bacterium]|nr:pyridoxamine 5'-phosphate oxidase [Flavobacteriaceae bacterium]MBL6683882.1 pyridoxamine 5'-phosphate oxidase [Flavobacteriaceae bacterium]
MKDLSDFRISYDKLSLIEQYLPQEPIKLFQIWFEELCKSNSVLEPNAMTLSTVSNENKPRNRVVLLKKFSEKGFVFYTNYKSKKGIDINNNPNVSISFFWPSFERQVIIEGICSKITYKESDKYFHSRPIDSQIGAIISNQSSEIPNRDYIENKFDSFKSDKTEILRPLNWGGYIINPINIEFWQGRKNRLHDRILYYKNDNSWLFKRLSP